MATPIKIGEVETDRFVLEVIECGRCGYHIGVDSSYLDQVGDINIKCPGCDDELDTSEMVDEAVLIG